MRSGQTEFTRHLATLVEANEPCAVATIVEVDGSASARPGAKAIVDGSGRLVLGWVGGGCAESTVREACLRAIAERRPQTLRLDLDDEVLGVGMPCGGHMTVFVEPYVTQPRLLVLGHGLIAETLAAVGKLLELRIAVNDPLATPEAFPDADERTTHDPDYAKAECDANTYVVITTQHRSDYEALSRVLGQQPAYVGLVASRKRTALLLERLAEDGFSEKDLRAVSAPAGLDLGAETPQEIALSILAEILQRIRQPATTGLPLVEVKGARAGERRPNETRGHTTT
ncbi:MAG: XdhC family protein [Myxococcota bacterium]